MRRQKGGQKEADLRGSSLGRYAVRPPTTSGLKSKIRPSCRTTTRGPICALPVRIREDAPDRRIFDGCRAAGENRSAFPGSCDETNVRSPMLIGHSRKASHSRLAMGVSLVSTAE